MSAAVARRRKQLAKKAACQSSDDPITHRLNVLLSSEERIDESTAYEALQLAQSQVRRHVKTEEYGKATVTFAYNVSLTLLKKHCRVSVASQLLALLLHVLKETHTACDSIWIQRVTEIDSIYLSALDRIDKTEMDVTERARLMRLHLKFLRSALSWSDALGTIRYGALEIQKLVGDHSWRLSESVSAVESGTGCVDADGDDGQDLSRMGLKCEAVTHLALAEEPLTIFEHLENLPKPNQAELCTGHTCAPALRDELLTRSILTFISVDNIRDAHVLLRGYIDNIEERTVENMKKSYMSKTDGMAPSHVIFNSMLLSICLKDKKTGPLYTWLLKSFSASEITYMYKADVLKAYTTKIGRLFFKIAPPPNMLKTLENMMFMMSGGGGGATSMTGMNPAIMQAMMQGQGM